MSAGADTDAQPAAETHELRRELAGHNFIPSRFFLDPFVSTYVGSETGFGYGWAQGRTFDVNGIPISIANYQVGAFAQVLDYQYGFLAWWAVRVSAKLVLYSGINSSGVAGVGTNFGANPSIGTTVSFRVGENLRLGGTLDLTFGPAVFFNLVQAVKDSINSGEIQSPVNSSSVFTLKPAFVGAWAINKAVGMTFSLEYKYTSVSGGTAGGSANLFQSSVLFDFDMNALNWVPIGFIGGFQTQFSVGDTKFREFQYNFGIFYTAVKPLNVGLEVVYNRAPVVGNTEIFLSSLLGLIVIQYNFN
jgi:hypothetical protein